MLQKRLSHCRPDRGRRRDPGGTPGRRAHDEPLASRLERGEALRVGYAIEAPFAFLQADGSISGEAPRFSAR